jgi:hypothetical protein
VSEKDEYPGLIRLPTMIPDGSITILWWPSSEPLPESFILQPTPDDPSVFNIVTKIETGA